MEELIKEFKKKMYLEGKSQKTIEVYGNSVKEFFKWFYDSYGNIEYRMIAEHEEKNNIIIPLEDMRLGMYMNIDTKENEFSIDVYIGYSDMECITGKEIIVAENADYAEIKQYFFDVLQLCVNEQIKKIRKCA